MRFGRYVTIGMLNISNHLVIFTKDYHTQFYFKKRRHCNNVKLEKRMKFVFK